MSRGAAADRLRRWEQFGGSWRVVARDDGTVTLALCRCDGGEELERLTAEFAEVAPVVGDRTAGP